MMLSGIKLACWRGDRPLFRELDIAVGAGEALWVSGANGSGKSSLLRLLCGLSRPQAGAVYWRGRAVHAGAAEFQREVMYCGHKSGIKDDLTAWENVAAAAVLSGRNCDRIAACAALEQVGLTAVAHLPAHALSQGQRKRVALARLCLPASSAAPALLMLDEPAAALDRVATGLLENLLDRHLARGGVLVYTTHQPLRLLHAGRPHRCDLDRVGSC